MRASRIVLLLVAILAGGLAAFLATRGDRPAQVVQGPEVVVEEAKVQVLVAATPIGVGERVTEASLEWQDWPEGAVRPEYITVANAPDAITEMAGTLARFEIFPGEPIRRERLVDSEHGYLSAVLPKGKRAVSIAVSADSASGGFIVPNDRVDVVLTRQGENGEVSETILANVKVMAIGDRLGEVGTTGAADATEAGQRPAVFSEAIATLELDPPQAETLINATRVGQLSLALRSITDFGEAEEEGRRGATSQTVRVIRGGQESMVSAGGSTRGPAPAPTIVAPPAAPSPAVADPAPPPEAVVDAPPPEPQVERQ